MNCHNSREAFPMKPGLWQASLFYRRNTVALIQANNLLQPQFQQAATTWRDPSLSRHRRTNRHLRFQQIQHSHQVKGIKGLQHFTDQFCRTSLCGLAQSTHGNHAFQLGDLEAVCTLYPTLPCKIKYLKSLLSFCTQNLHYFSDSSSTMQGDNEWNIFPRAQRRWPKPLSAGRFAIESCSFRSTTSYRLLSSGCHEKRRSSKNI